MAEKYLYCIDEYGEDVEDAREFFSNYNPKTDLDSIAEQAAVHFWSEEDYIDFSDHEFPVTLIIYGKEENYLGLFKIEVEFEPIFIATEIQP